jgi:glycerol-1-phosphate dehydrogenase [NAD(P)+]
LSEVVAEVAVDDEANARLATYLDRAGWRAALVVMDANTEEAAGRDVVRELGGVAIDAEELVFEQRSGLYPEPEQVDRVRARMKPRSIPVAVGSGVITDIVRYAAHERGRDFVSVATAASMDGYASGVAALSVNGVKVTRPARPPLALFADPRVIAAAPAVLTRAGAGDLLAKASARVDWLASHLLYGEPFSAAAADRVLGPLRFATAHAARIAGGEPAAVSELLAGLIESGNAIALAGNSRPASGCEHHASHFWDLLAARGLREHGSHGLQVGYATRFSTRLQRFAFGRQAPSLRAPVVPADPLGAGAREWLGEPVPEIEAAVAGKRDFIERSAGRWPADERDWAQRRERLAPALELAERVPHALDALGIPSAPGYLEVDERTLRATFRFASRLRARYTTIDFLEGQGTLEDGIDAIVW